LVTVSEACHIPVYCNRPTLEAIEFKHETKLDSRLFITGASFELGDISVETFTIPHDAQDPVGFMLRTNEGNIGFLTDLGHTTKLVLERVRNANVLVLESNHDVKMLQDCPHRPWNLKQRILSRHGHLSNEAAADATEQIMNGELHHLYLGHLSRQCNRPELAMATVQQRLQQIGATHVTLEVTSQQTPSPTLTLQKSMLAARVAVET
jgi:phosphoribosyl 1,2-cyclic phosphodiesterase